ncbi:transforming acidic coiled-coil-containing protein 3-like [Xenia sp. Carnegie-2017]|uniref:transforming acidic coiled-coil-containing protein 3-like n=1 Tax=Xenia sp. Carnegie-2017 TaxID=2897299 RepID=UPI001F040F86|nr:transforming acidic coiled-coil-containing protein 3-like [Xenia sp. Carnegie-2017]XP_046850036.1 transforming acidic coiled-coil-containing protein 3-like [Xenia sp. Carnegie-2017]
MEKPKPTGKENIFDGIICSPILSSGSSHDESKGPHSPLTERNLTCLGKGLESKVGIFPSTPLLKSSVTDKHRDLWEEIRKLDEEELWIERTQILTKEDHILYGEFAKEIVTKIINNLPIFTMDETAEDHGIVKDRDVNYDIETSLSGQKVVCEEEKDVIANGKDDIQIDESEMVENGEVKGDHDFINSCTEFDTTIKETSVNDESCLENTLSEFDKSSEDLNVTVKEAVVDSSKFSDSILDETVKEVTDADGNEKAADSEVHEYDGVNLDESSFKQATEFSLDLDFLEKCGNINSEEFESELARQSLYVKFDPLVQARKPNKQSDQESLDAPTIKPSDLLFQGSSALSSDDLLLGMDTPPAKSVVSRRDLLDRSENVENAEENAMTSPVVHVDPFSFSPNKNEEEVCENKNINEESPNSNEDSVVESTMNEQSSDTSLVQPLQFSKTDLDRAVHKEKERMQSELNLQNNLHEVELEKLLDERKKLLDENKVIKTLMMEYEQTMAQMIKDRETEQSKQEKSNAEIVQERDQLQRDLNNTEKSFAHLHEKFGKLKTAVESYQKNEEVLKKVVKDLQEDVKNADKKYQILKGHAEQKLQEANVEINRVQTTFNKEVACLQAALKREKTKISSLQQNLDQKTSENKELTAICDELISKVGR